MMQSVRATVGSIELDLSAQLFREEQQPFSPYVSLGKRLDLVCGGRIQETSVRYDRPSTETLRSAPGVIPRRADARARVRSADASATSAVARLCWSRNGRCELLSRVAIPGRTSGPLL